MIGERGSTLSGGQRQRVAIARALLTNPRILIFDEATSALDYESERIIQDNMATIAKGRTVLVIAHRLSTVRTADRIITIERRRASSRTARHDQLLRTNGRYARAPLSIRRRVGRRHRCSGVDISKGARADVRQPAIRRLTRLLVARTSSNSSPPRSRCWNRRPSPAGRILAICICALFASVIGWASWAEIDIVAVARGQGHPLRPDQGGAAAGASAWSRPSRCRKAST